MYYKRWTGSPHFLMDSFQYSPSCLNPISLPYSVYTLLRFENTTEPLWGGEWCAVMVPMGEKQHKKLLQFSQITEVRIHLLCHGRGRVPIHFSSSQNFCGGIYLLAAILNIYKNHWNIISYFKMNKLKRKDMARCFRALKKKFFPLTLNHSRADMIKAQAWRWCFLQVEWTKERRTSCLWGFTSVR